MREGENGGGAIHLHFHPINPTIYANNVASPFRRWVDQIEGLGKTFVRYHYHNYLLFDHLCVYRPRNRDHP